MRDREKLEGLAGNAYGLAEAEYTRLFGSARAMTRFYLNIRVGDTLIQYSEGDDVPDLEAARNLALDALRDMRRLLHSYGEPLKWETQEFVITDESDRQLLTIPFSHIANEK